MKKAKSFDDVLLVPKLSDIASRDAVSLATEICGVSLSLPILSANMASVTKEDMALAVAKLGGLGVLDRTTLSVNEAAAIVNKGQQVPLPMVASIGVGSHAKQLADILYSRGVRFMCVDVAHGHHVQVLSLAKSLLEEKDGLRLIIGNIATADSARFFSEGIDPSYHGQIALKVGVGSGSLCSTRIMTGFGIPTLQSVFDVEAALASTPIGLIADGGIKNSGDIVKCLAAGADAVMLGSLLAGTDEAPGEIIKDDRTDTLYKVYQGSASFGVKKAHTGKTTYLEGAETLVPYKGPVENVLNRLADGIRSGLSYCGARSIFKLQVSAEFIRVSSSGAIESAPHGLR